MVPCWWFGWWLWRAGCISQDTFLLYPDCCQDCRILHHPAHLVCQFSALFASQGLTSLCDALLKQKEYPVIQIDFPTAMSDMAEVSLNSKWHDYPQKKKGEGYFWILISRRSNLLKFPSLAISLLARDLPVPRGELHSWGQHVPIDLLNFRSHSMQQGK